MSVHTHMNKNHVIHEHAGSVQDSMVQVGSIRVVVDVMIHEEKLKRFLGHLCTLWFYLKDSYKGKPQKTHVQKLFMGCRGLKVNLKLNQHHSPHQSSFFK